MEVRNHRLNPVEAEIWITLRDAVADMQLRGRLTGPRCPYATTVEVAYPLTPLPSRRAKPGHLTAQVIIPEPSLWDPESPFLYEGSIEVWKSGHYCSEETITHGLRAFHLGKGGLHCNGSALSLRGVARRQLSEEDALQLRREGYNTLVSAVCAETAALWDAADRLGFLVLGRLSDTHAAFRQAESLKSHACCLGWLLPASALEQGVLAGVESARIRSGNGQLLGIELDQPPRDWDLPEIDFMFAKEDLLPLEGEVDCAILVRSPHVSGAGERKEQARASSAVLGWIME